MSRIFILAVPCLAMVLLALACASSSGVTIAGTTVQGTGGGAQIEVVAPVTSFGSIYSGGLRFATEGARVLINGQEGSLTELRPGMYVSIKGTYAEGSASGNAELIDYRARLAGPVEALDAASGNMTVNGVTVSIAHTSEYGYGDVVAGIAVGSSVVMSGEKDGLGVFRVTYLAPNSTGLVTTSTSEPSNYATAGSGYLVRSGFVSGFFGNTFRMQGTSISFDDSTLFEGLVRSLKDNDRVDVLGKIQPGGSVLAVRIRVHPSMALAVKTGTRVETVDAASGTFVVGGVKYRVTANTVFTDRSLNGGGQLGISSLTAGDEVVIYVDNSVSGDIPCAQLIVLSLHGSSSGNSTGSGAGGSNSTGTGTGSSNSTGSGAGSSNYTGTGTGSGNPRK